MLLFVRHKMLKLVVTYIEKCNVAMNSEIRYIQTQHFCYSRGERQW